MFYSKTEEFVSLMEKRDFARLKKMLDEGFDPNSTYELEVGYSYDNGLIHGTETVERRLLDLAVCKNSPALQKLLRHYGGKTEKEICEENERRKREEHRAKEEARIQEELAEVEKLLGL